MRIQIVEYMHRYCVGGSQILMFLQAGRGSQRSLKGGIWGFFCSEDP
jgi:hypothetical protein